MAWSNQLHIRIPPRVVLALAPVVTQSGAFLMRQNLFSEMELLGFFRLPH